MQGDRGCLCAGNAPSGQLRSWGRAEAVPHLCGGAVIRPPACMLLGLGFARMCMLVSVGWDGDALLHHKLPLRKSVLLRLDIA